MTALDVPGLVLGIPGQHRDPGTLSDVAVLRLFASAREAAGTGRAEFPAHTVGAVLDAAVREYGTAFADVLPTCRVWVNGESADADTAVGASDEVAVLPPVSGGCR